MLDREAILQIPHMSRKEEMQSPQALHNCQAISNKARPNKRLRSLLNTDPVNNLYNYPFAMETTTSGLGVTHIPRGVIGDQISMSWSGWSK